MFKTSAKRNNPCIIYLRFAHIKRVIVINCFINILSKQNGGTSQFGQNDIHLALCTAKRLISVLKKEVCSFIH